MDHAVEELRLDAILLAHRNHAAERQAPAAANSPSRWRSTRGRKRRPIVADNTMYMVTAYPNIVYALDLTKPGAPLKWKFAPKPLPASQGVACCDVVNRGGTVDRQVHFQHARRPDHCARCQDRQARLADAARQYQHRRDHHHGAAGGRRPSVCRQFRRRDGSARLDRGAR